MASVYLKYDKKTKINEKYAIYILILDFSVYTIKL